jgi:hypothetical protein
MQWTVERLSNINDFRGNPRFRQPEHTVVEAETVDIEGGSLIFKNGEDLVAAFGAGAWASVNPVSEETA